MKISIVIPTFNREQHLKNCLSSLLVQKKIPYEVLVVDNAKHYKAKDIVDSSNKAFTDNGVKLTYLRNKENSGATARNLGAFNSKGDLIAFLDDDVKLDTNYYYEIERVFLSYPKALGVQGWDPTVKKSFEKTNSNFLRNLLYKFEKFFMISSFFENGRSRVLPSLCVTNPSPDNFNSTVQSEWISTCAGVFSKKVFEKFKFDSELKKYSWNEYIDFSYAIFLENSKSLFVTPKATYFDVQTKDGRLNLKELIYMAEVYDSYIFYRQFEMTFKNIFFYSWSKIGRVIFNILKIITRRPKEFYKIYFVIHAPIYVLFNLSKIKKGDLNFFNKTLS